MKRPNRLGVRAAALAVSASLLVGGCDFNVYELPLPGGADVGDNSYTVTVYFDDVLDLVPQSAVKVDDVTVGKVEDISLQGYTAEVLLRLNGKVNLPDNAVANIRQTSLLGEKFVALSPPPDGSGTGRLGPGEEIPLERSGRNPEVEEVLGALSLLLNGGGVAQLKTITVELNKVLEGNEEGIKSLLAQLDTFMGQIDDNKQDIVRAIEAVNRLAKTAKEQTSSINAALDRMPRALDSLDKQRDDLIRMLDALGRLSDVGTRVIRASKANTVNSLESLAPILSQLADAGRSLPKALQVFLTYPFVDAVVGTTPAEARNLHQGDFTNLSAKLDIDLEQMLATPPGLPAPPELPHLPGLPNLPTPPGGPSIPDPGDLPDNPLGGGQQPRGGGGDDPGSGLLPSQPPNADGAGGTEPGAGSGNASQDSGCLLVLCRTRPAYSGNTETEPSDTARLGYDPDVAALMLQGVTRR
jgi:phospholipid/cholesterol/gamma-HCH transport system substrate-binding protein